MSNRSLARRLVGVPWPPLLAVTLIVLLLVTVLWSRRAGTRDPSIFASQPVTILVSGDTRGALAPYPCSGALSGGLVQRAELIRGLRENGDLLVADIGNAIDVTGRGNSPYHLAKLTAIVRGERLLGAAAHNIGPGEAALGAEQLRSMARESGVPFLSTNLRQADGNPIVDTHLLLRRGGRRIAVLGFLSPRLVADESGAAGLIVVPPVEALSEALHWIDRDYDDLLVLAYLEADELAELTDALPNRAIVAARAGSLAVQRGEGVPVFGGRPIAAVGEFGASLVRFDLSAEKVEWTINHVALSGELADDAEQSANLAAFHRQLAAADYPPAATGLALELSPHVATDHRVAGSEVCRACHAAECFAWDNSAHARAWQSLVDRGVQYDADCQRCHTTGYGWPGGFESAERSLTTVSVGCESCHGPSLTHALDPAIRTPLVAHEQCATCHTSRTSPAFDLDAYWSRIRHGKSLADPAAANSADSAASPARIN